MNQITKEKVINVKLLFDDFRPKENESKDRKKKREMINDLWLTNNWIKLCINLISNKINYQLSPSLLLIITLIIIMINIMICAVFKVKSIHFFELQKCDRDR